jgi:hypothetical protein
MKMLNLTLCAVAGLSLLAVAGLLYQRSDYRQLRQIRAELVQENPALQDMEPLALAIALRDKVHGYSGYGTQGVDFSQFRDTFRAAQHGQTHICSGLSFLYMITLKSFGLDSRYVGFYAETENAARPVESHATTEVFIDGKWIALDPTYAVSVMHGGKHIGWLEARDIILSGGQVDFVADGVKPSLPLMDFSRVVRNVAVGPSRKTGAFLSWNGEIRYADGGTYHVSLDGHYERIAK